MNERIRELVTQAGITTNLDTDYFERDINQWVDYYSEKFAELIIQECVIIMHANERLPVGFFYAKPAHIHELAIKQHFGLDNE